MKKDPKLEQAQQTEEFKQGNDQVQDIAALVKVRKHMSPSEWSGYKSQLIAKAPKEKKPELGERLTTAEDQYKDAQDKLREEIKKLGANPDLDPNPDLVLQASNNLYAAALMDVQKARRARAEAMANMKPNDEVSKARVVKAELDLKRAMAKSLDFANEAYNSEGALIDVVGLQQGAVKGAGVDPASIQLSPQEMLSSFNEQFGDALKDLHHYGHASAQEEELEGRDPAAKSAGDGKRFIKATVQVAKYVKRMVDVGGKICGQPNAAKKPSADLSGQLTTLDDTCDKLLPLRGNPAIFAQQKGAVPEMAKGKPPADGKARPDAKPAHDEKGAIKPQDFGVAITSLEVFKGLLLRVNLEVNEVGRSVPAIGNTPPKPNIGPDAVG
jgi:hypothetical protein